MTFVRILVGFFRDFTAERREEISAFHALLEALDQQRFGVFLSRKVRDYEEETDVSSVRQDDRNKTDYASLRVYERCLSVPWCDVVMQNRLCEGIPRSGAVDTAESAGKSVDAAVASSTARRAVQMEQRARSRRRRAFPPRRTRSVSPRHEGGFGILARSYDAIGATLVQTADQQAELQDEEEDAEKKEEEIDGEGRFGGSILSVRTIDDYEDSSAIVRREKPPSSSFARLVDFDGSSVDGSGCSHRRNDRDYCRSCHRRRRRWSFSDWISRARRRCFKIYNWFPKMCSCIDGNSTLPGSRSSFGHNDSYERLGSASTIFELGSMMQRTRRRAGNREEEVLDSERQEELRFYNDDLTWTTVVVEKNLRTIDLCELLQVKRNVSGTAWSVVETWPELGIERTLEDHEDILAVHREMKMFASHHERKFFFRQDFLKYEFFIDLKQFFPTDMVAFPYDEDRGTFAEIESTLRNYLSREDGECPQVFSLVWMRDEVSNTWRKTYMLLRSRKLYTLKKVVGVFPKRLLESEHLTPLAHLSDYNAYRIPNAKRYFNAPFEWGACLRPSSNAEAEDTEAGEPGLKVIAFQTEKSRACWLIAMRLAKYGKQLRENYRTFKNKQCEQTGSGSPTEQYNSYSVTNESVRSRVAMDFTGSVGRIVEDPKEAKDIAESEGILWRRRWRPFSRTPSGCAMVKLHGLDGGIHVLQPWFHGSLKREIAAAIIRDHGSVDGVFLVRESKSNPGAYVLTYKYSEKVFHTQIQPVFDERRNCWLYTLDKGITKFYDLLQLIEFYQLNAGSLPTRLTHYVQNSVPASVPRPEDGGASPSPPETGNQRLTGKNECVSTAGI